MKKLLTKKEIIYTILTILITFELSLLLSIVFSVLLFKKIQEYTYSEINNNNKEQIINLLQEQEKYISSFKKDIDSNVYYTNLERIEVVFKFPDGEDYVLYY